MAGERVVVRNQAGEPYTVEAAEVDHALKTGFRLETPEEAHQAELEEKHGEGLGNEVMAGAEAAGRALTLGGSTYVQKALGADPEAIQAREEFNPVAAGVGTAVGIAAPLVLTAGASAPLAAGKGALGAAKGVAGLTAPALISRAGQAATKGVGAILPKASGLAGKALAKSLSVGVGGAVEGAAYGVGEVVHEAALGDPNLTAESAIGTIGLAAALGGGFGGLLGVGEVAVPAALGKAREAVGGLFKKGQEGLENAAVKAAELAGKDKDVATLMIEHRAEVSALQREMPGIADDMANATPEMAAWTLQNGERLREMERAFPGTTRQLARTSPETAEKLLGSWQKIITDPAERMRAAADLHNGMQSVLDKTDDVLREMNTKFAPREAEALLASADEGAVRMGYESTLAKVDDAIHTMRAEPELHAGTVARSLEKIREGLVRDAADRLNPLDAFNRLKTLRQQLDQHIPYGKNAMSLGISERNAVNVLQDVRSSVKKMLTDEAVFGPAAARRAALDDAQSEWLRLVGNGSGNKRGVFHKLFKLDANGKLPVDAADQWLNAMAKRKGDVQAKVWGDVVAAAKKVIAEADASFKSSPVGEFDRAAVEGLVGKAAKRAEDIHASGKATATMKQLALPGGNGIASSGPFMPGMDLAGKAAEFVLPGAVTSSVKAVLSLANTARSVPRMVQVLSALDAAGKSLSRGIDTAAGVLVRGSVKATRIGRSEAAAGISRVFDRTPEEARSTFLRRVKDIQSQANPQALHERLTAQTESLHEDAPNTAQAIQAASARGIAFLQTKMPKPPNNGPLGPEWVPSQAQVSKFNRYYQAVEDPTAILKQAAAGTLTPEAVEAVKTVYPQLYQKMAMAVMDKLTSHRGDVPYRSRLMLGLLLGQDVDGSLKPERILRSQAAFQSSANQTPSTPGPSPAKADSLTVASRSLTPMQRAGAREE